MIQGKTQDVNKPRPQLEVSRKVTVKTQARATSCAPELYLTTVQYPRVHASACSALCHSRRGRTCGECFEQYIHVPRRLLSVEATILRHRMPFLSFEDLIQNFPWSKVPLSIESNAPPNSSPACIRSRLQSHSRWTRRPARRSFQRSSHVP